MLRLTEKEIELNLGILENPDSTPAIMVSCPSYLNLSDCQNCESTSCRECWKRALSKALEELKDDEGL